VSWPPLLPALRSASHYAPSQLALFLWERVLRMGELASPVAPQRLLGPVAAASDPDRSVLAAWGARPEASILAPAWLPARHGDPRRAEFSYLGLSRSFPGPLDWDPKDLPLLWRYRLHYFDGPAALAAAEPSGDWQPWLAGLLEDHWRRCRPGRGAAWAAFPLAVRVANLLRVWALLQARGGALPQLDRQLRLHCGVGRRYLALRLERHLRGNHLLKELCVLAMAARVFGDRAALGRWLAALAEQVGSQFLSGGGHQERSLRYHLDCMRDLLELRAVLGESAPGFLLESARRGLDFAADLEHGDGDIPLFNDAELGISPGRSALATLLSMPARDWRGVHSFPEEGYVAARLGDARLVFDCGPVGPDHQPGHAHCDVLSFELSLGAQRVAGNRGTLAYGSGPERTLSRCTASHSTVQVGDAEQVEIWSGFRVGWRGAPRLGEARMDGAVARMSGSYAWHPRVGATHSRTLELHPGGRVRVEDRVTGARPGAPVVARLWMPGAAIAEADPDGRWLLVDSAGAPWRVAAVAARIAARTDDWFPCLGERRPALCVECRPDRMASDLRFSTTLEPGTP
jgi:uncharacterized heparinase superfamily protein